MGRLPVAHCHCGRGCGGRQKRKGFRCPEMLYQPYLRPKWVILDKKTLSVLRQQFTIVLPFFLVFRAACLWCTTIAVGGLGVLDALRCIPSLIWAPNEWFQWKSFFELRNKITFFTLFFGVHGRLPVAHLYCSWGSGGCARPPKARRF